MSEIDKRVHTLNNVFDRLDSILGVLNGRRDETNREAIEVLETIIENASTASYQEALVRLDDEGLKEYYKNVIEFVLVLARKVGIPESSLMEGTASSAFHVSGKPDVGNTPVQFSTPQDFWDFMLQNDSTLSGLISILQGDTDLQELSSEMIAAMTKQAARNFITNHVLTQDDLPLVQELYGRAMDGSTSTYEVGSDSAMAILMAGDMEAQPNKIIPTRLSDGITSGTNGRVAWNRSDDLKYTIGSSRFDWKLTSYDEEESKATVLVTVTDRFDFNKGGRSFKAEFLTGIGRTAELSSFDIIVTYEKKFSVEMPKIEGDDK